MTNHLIDISSPNKKIVFICNTHERFVQGWGSKKEKGL
jgi:hypothetical protein